MNSTRMLFLSALLVAGSISKRVAGDDEPESTVTSSNSTSSDADASKMAASLKTGYKFLYTSVYVTCGILLVCLLIAAALYFKGRAAKLRLEKAAQ